MYPITPSALRPVTRDVILGGPIPHLTLVGLEVKTDSENEHETGSVEFNPN